MRKKKVIVISDPGRDRGKIFHLEEMAAYQAFGWGWRAARLMVISGFEMPSEVAEQGIAAVWLAGFWGMIRVNYEEAKPLLDELMGCVQHQPDPNNTFLRPSTPDDIQELKTIALLQKEALDLSINFSEIVGDLVLLLSGVRISTEARPTTSQQEVPVASPDTPIFQQPLVRPSPRASAAMQRRKRP